ncbi:Arylsulfatase A [Lutibacter agarilyticus]|uniref:Arylsulfatase A n=1 Tax=Lutibacter agarilyticus TaxID=1109740 RepID=A0A238V9X0_9FLAO|nr:arylsulfatase [Lutibacter agarilyticus]SNR30924.1 Arylsulfatase A [Lutibacter agarilyticus]
MKLLKFSVLIILAFSSCAKKKNPSPISETILKPNVILVITDDQGYGDVGVLGNTIIKTPNIDAFHGESYHLTDFHVGPTCAPTRSGLMTGRYANSVGVWHTVGGWSLLREQEKTLANMFTEAGYKTGGFGKWHLGDNYPFRPEDRGFQETVMHGGGGVQQTPDYWNNTYFNDTYFKNGKPTKFEGYCTDVFFGEAINFIEQNKDKPFFCYIAPNAPHGPYNVPMEYYNLYKNLSEDVLAEKQKRFYGMITNIDDNFGKLRTALKELNIADNTILIFMTDNGTSAGYYYNKKKNSATGYNAEMRGAKGSAYEGGHRVPFFIHWKNGDISTSKDFSQLTAQLDIMPTLAELCGIKLPKEHLALDGKSLVPLFKNEEKSLNRMLVTDSQRIQQPEKWRNSAVMQDTWRLINGSELYNIKEDKGQENNIAEQYPEKVAEMRTFYENWWQQVSVDFDKEIFFKIGLENINPVTLTAHDIHAQNGMQPWNQEYIRQGVYGEGYWDINVVKEGDYKISLRRYPIESNLKINTIVKGITTVELPGLEKDLSEGVNLNYVKASLNFDNKINKEVTVSNQDLSADFKLHLKQGKTKMNASFYNSKGKENVAYYVYITKL